MDGASLLRSELADAIARAGVAVRWLQPEELDEVVSRIVDQYATGRGFALWERLSAEGLHDPEGWRYLCSLLRDLDIVLAGEQGGQYVGLEMNGRGLETLLDGAPLFVFYVSDPTVSFLAAFNDHDHMILDDPHG